MLVKLTPEIVAVPDPGVVIGGKVPIVVTKDPVKGSVAARLGVPGYGRSPPPQVKTGSEW